MALVPYLKWLGVGAVVLAATWTLTRRVASPSRRLALRCLATSAALTPQPLWAPGEGGFVMPALALLLFGGAPLFNAAMGGFPILAVGMLLFTLAGWRLGLSAVGAERLAHQAAWRWVVVGLALPLLALAATAPFLAFFLFGGPIAAWGAPSLAVLGGAAVLDWRAARRADAPAEPRRLRWAAYLLAALLAVLWVGLHARRLTGAG
ncbi:MAG: hypothetical protein ACREM3_08460 [Candidatus Rokuibacteriota bacterium]